MGHTSGPWTISQWGDREFDIYAGEKHICELKQDYESEETQAEVEANARLIAEAPALLETIDQVCAALETCMAHYGEQMCEADRRSRRAALDAARKAQANAEGFATWAEALASEDE